jgi:RNA polymerase sigma-70 factor (ECF subfamily)
VSAATLHRIVDAMLAQLRVMPAVTKELVPALRGRARKGDVVEDSDTEGVFSEAFDRCAPSVLRFARRRLGNPDAAWDVVNETFTTAWRHWDRRPSDEELLPWLYAIARNAVRDELRAAGRRSRLTARLFATSLTHHTSDSADGVVLGQSVREAFARLPAADREVLRLVAWEGLGDARSVGLTLGLSAATARVRIHRARHRLRALMAESGTEQRPEEIVPRQTPPVRCPSTEA